MQSRENHTLGDFAIIALILLLVAVPLMVLQSVKFLCQFDWNAIATHLSLVWVQLEPQFDLVEHCLVGCFSLVFLHQIIQHGSRQKQLRQATSLQRQKDDLERLWLKNL
jgi:hypothetical protein